MSKKIGRNTYTLDKPIYVIGRANKTSQKEADGPLGKYFDDVANDDTLGEETFEKAERRLMEETVFHAISNANKKEEEIEHVNQVLVDLGAHQQLGLEDSYEAVLEKGAYVGKFPDWHCSTVSFLQPSALRCGLGCCLLFLRPPGVWACGSRP